MYKNVSLFIIYKKYVLNKYQELNQKKCIFICYVQRKFKLDILNKNVFLCINVLVCQLNINLKKKLYSMYIQEIKEKISLNIEKIYFYKFLNEPNKKNIVSFCILLIKKRK